MKAKTSNSIRRRSCRKLLPISPKPFLRHRAKKFLKPCTWIRLKMPHQPSKMPCQLVYLWFILKDTNPCIRGSSNTPPSHEHATIISPLHQPLLHNTAHAVSQCSTPSSSLCFIHSRHHFSFKKGRKQREKGLAIRGLKKERKARGKISLRLAAYKEIWLLTLVF